MLKKSDKKNSISAKKDPKNGPKIGQK